MKLLRKMPEIVLLVILFTMITRQSVNSTSAVDSITDVKDKFKIEDARKFFPSATDIKVTSVDEGIVKDKEGKVLGRVLSTSPVADNIIGYAGKVPVLIAIDNNEIIAGVKLLPNIESRGFIKRIKRKGFFCSWNEMSVKDALTADIDVVSGASMTTGAVKEGVQLRLSKYLEAMNTEKHIDWMQWLAYAASLFVVIFALLSFTYPKSFAKKRVILLVASILILGFWRGEFISLALMYGWLLNGVPVMSKLIIFSIILLAIILPLFTNKAFYCTYVCPYGAAQELTSKLQKKKIKLSSKVLKYLKYVRMVFFYGLVIMIIAGYSIDLSNVEPFAAFLTSVASPSAIIIASVFLIISIFVPKAWCHYFCPTGYFLEVFRKGKL